jgi:hypothetical protein
MNDGLCEVSSDIHLDKMPAKHAAHAQPFKGGLKCAIPHQQKWSLLWEEELLRWEGI